MSDAVIIGRWVGGELDGRRRAVCPDNPAWLAECDGKMLRVLDSAELYAVGSYTIPTDVIRWLLDGSTPAPR